MKHYKDDVKGSVKIRSLLGALASLEMRPRVNSTGSIGYNLSTRVAVELEGGAVLAQLGLNATVIEPKDKVTGEKLRLSDDQRAKLLAGPSATVGDLGILDRFVTAKEFKSGSVGFFFNDKATVEVDGEQHKLQIGLIVTCIGSDKWEALRPAAEPEAEAPQA